MTLARCAATRRTSTKGPPQNKYCIVIARGSYWPWTIAGDGTRLLAAMPPAEDVQMPITVVLNWQADLR